MAQDKSFDVDQDKSFDSAQEKWDGAATLVDAWFSVTVAPSRPEEGRSPAGTVPPEWPCKLRKAFL